MTKNYSVVKQCPGTAEENKGLPEEWFLELVASDVHLTYSTKPSLAFSTTHEMVPALVGHDCCDGHPRQTIQRPPLIGRHYPARNARARLWIGERGEARELLAPAAPHRLAELAVEVAEEEERLVAGPLLAHEDERRRGREQQDRRKDLQLVLVGERREALAVRAVADLVVVLHEVDERPRRQMRARLATRLLAERRDLALVGEAFGKRARCQLLCCLLGERGIEQHKGLRRRRRLVGAAPHEGKFEGSHDPATSCHPRVFI
jgi:hypothetical protein